MRKALLAMIAVLVAAGTVSAQQGSVQVTAATLVNTGDPIRTGAQQSYEPDFGLAWFQPATRFGTVLFDVHAVRNNNDPRIGRSLFSLKDLKAAGFSWNFEAGDTVHTPFITDYGFSNLFAPQLTFRGGNIGATSATTSFSVTAGRVTVLRDMFGANADVLGQTLFVARLTHKLTNRVEMNARASSVRTNNLKEFYFTNRKGDDAGVGVKVSITPAWQLIGDTGYTSYQRRDQAGSEQQASGLVGARWTGADGWFQVNAHRFSPGSFSVLNYSYTDREGVFAAAQYQFAKRVRVDGGWDLFKSNLEAERDLTPTTMGTSTGSRAHASIRVSVNSHLFLGARVEDGARSTQPSRYSLGYESDTGAQSGEVEVRFAKWTAIGRYEHRSNVDVSGGSSTFGQQDWSAQLHYRVSSRAQVFTTAFVTDRRDTLGGGQSYWHASGGGQVQLHRRDLFARAELMVSRSRDFLSDFLTPRTALSLGLGARITSRLSLSIDSYIDRSPIQTLQVNPWATRSIARVHYTLPTGSGAVSLNNRHTARAGRGSEVIEGTVFADWNSNNLREGGEAPIEAVALVLDGDVRVTSDASGRFQFEHVAPGPHTVTLDLATVAADFDPPTTTELTLNVRHGERPTISYGMLPLGDIEGTVVADSNSSGAADASDAKVEGAVLVLDDGARTEVTRDGKFRFIGVRPGTHKLRLLTESLPEDTSVMGVAQIDVVLSRDQRVANAGFVLKLEKRPEIRKTFPPKK